MSKYPRIGAITGKASRPSFKKMDVCDMCGQGGSDTVVDIEFDYFRGNDSSYLVHRACLQNARKEQPDTKVILWVIRGERQP